MKDKRAHVSASTSPLSWVDPVHPSGGASRALTWLKPLAITLAAIAVAWTLRSVTGVSLSYAIAFVVVGVLLNSNLAHGLASLLVISCAGAVLMHSKAEVMTLLLLGSAFTIAQVYITAKAGERLGRIKEHLAKVEHLLQRSRRNLNEAGILVVVLDPSGTWVAANPASFAALGIPPDSLDLAGPNMRISADAALSLMSSGSQDSWRHLLRTSLASWGQEGTQTIQLPLTTAEDETYVYDVLLERAADGSVMLIGRKR
ncbi:MAG: hypothetical protein O9327_05090 [Polaromonas sp.]|nr:hypothetical protein [Polaromonas sp.]